ncbi:MAG: TrmB family transcriptional regulator [Candidatus Woesearchaeota archaeon]
MDTNILETLESLGLSKNETILFVTLIKIGESKSGEIISETKLQSSAVYNALHSLIKKGLISYVKKNKINYYKAANPENLIDYIEAKKREISQIIPQLSQKEKNTAEENVEFFETHRGIKLLILQLFNDTKKGDIYRSFACDTEYNEKAIQKVYRAEKHLRIEKAVTTKIIYPETSRTITKTSKTSQKRFSKQKLPPNTNLINGKVAIISWGKKPFGVLIRSETIFNQYVTLFEDLWKKSKE